jgi:hypothetical protein
MSAYDNPEMPMCQLGMIAQLSLFSEAQEG